MPDTSYSITLFLERNHELGSALLLLDNALSELHSFTKRHPERVDSNVRSAMDRVAEAHAYLDSDFYSEHNAERVDPVIRDLSN